MQILINWGSQSWRIYTIIEAIFFMPCFYSKIWISFTYEEDTSDNLDSLTNEESMITCESDSVITYPNPIWMRKQDKFTLQAIVMFDSENLDCGLYAY